MTFLVRSSLASSQKARVLRTEESKGIHVKHPRTMEENTWWNAISSSKAINSSRYGTTAIIILIPIPARMYKMDDAGL